MVSEKEIEALQTGEQRYATRRYEVFYLPRSVIRSKAFRALRERRSATTIWVYLIFRTKCQMKRLQHKPRSRKDWIIANNGKIKFPYKEAKALGISEGAFRDAIDLLLEMGFIDITYLGTGLKGDYSLYAISDRWRTYGTPEFEKRTRPKRGEQYGFTRGNSQGRNSKK